MSDKVVVSILLPGWLQNTKYSAAYLSFTYSLLAKKKIRECLNSKLVFQSSHKLLAVIH